MLHPGECPIQVFDVLTSTNDSILEAGRLGAPEGTCHIARTQTRGRGRGDHRWWSPPDAGLWMSILLRPRLPLPRWCGLSLVAGVAARSALTRLGVRGVEVFWPNDLMVGSRKLGGILSDVRSDASTAWAALGVGINIDLTAAATRAAMPPELRERVICMTEAGPPETSDPVEIAMAFLSAWRPLYERCQDGELLRSIVGEDLAHAGRSVRVLAAASPPLRATVLGLDHDGALLVRDDDRNVHRVVAATIEYESPRAPACVSF
jgi:BirA family biotin operon repressor/biotin-[acetyl-CoA-carboxylase] ligase